jgi:hypothetical protein
VKASVVELNVVVPVQFSVIAPLGVPTAVGTKLLGVYWKLHAPLVQVPAAHAGPVPH